MKKACKAFTKQALAAGTRAEAAEHPWASKATARKIARDHLCENPKEYARGTLGSIESHVVQEMTAGQINKKLDALGAQSRDLTDALIAAGRGDELPSETRQRTDALSRKWQQNADQVHAMRNEIERRYGPNAPLRLPKGYRYR